MAFMTSFDKEEQLYLLKALIILYRLSFKQIGEIKFYAYLMQLFNKVEDDNIHFYLLQYLLVTLSIEEPRISKKNRKKFIKQQGLEVLFDQVKKALIKQPVVMQDQINYTLSKTCN